MPLQRIKIWLFRTVLASALAAPLANVRAQKIANSLPVPPPCTILHAHLTANSSAVRHNKNVQIDTQRIQHALSLCNPGQAVVLRPYGVKNAFLSAPLMLPRGVTLFLDTGTTLFASRNPRDYDVSPFSCGAPRNRTVQCKPFLFSYQAAYSGILGTGTIDGQGGTRLNRAQRSWWQLQRSAEKEGGASSTPDLISTYESQGFRVLGVTLRNAAGAHLAIYKTIDFNASYLHIDSPEDSAAGPGILLSNAHDATVGNTWIQTPSVAITLRASILGSTSYVDLHHLNIEGGQGISIGDPQYGKIENLQIKDVTLRNAGTGLTMQLTGADGKGIHNVLLQDICMQHVAASMRLLDANGHAIPSIPGANAVQFDDVSIAGLGTLTGHGPERDAAQKCTRQPSTNAIGKAVFAPLPSSVAKPGTLRSLVVAQDSTGNFRSIQQAIDALPDSGGSIAIRPGIYREVVTVRKPHVFLQGDPADPNAVTIVFNNGAAHSGGTFNSATVFVEADDVSLDDLTITNDLGYGKGQAVALAVTGDRDVFRWVRIHGHQDTLFAASKYCYGDYGPCIPARQYFSHCFIDGNVDFIFGDSVAVFDHCELHGNAKGNVMFTAQSKHYAEQESGYVFDHCKLTAAPRTRGIVSLGRPWRPYATVVYLHTRMDANIFPQGWKEWPRFGEPSLPTAFFAEFDSTGLGADPAAREPYSHQLTAAEATHFSPARFLAGKDGWNPTTK